MSAAAASNSRASRPVSAGATRPASARPVSRGRAPQPPPSRSELGTDAALSSSAGHMAAPVVIGSYAIGATLGQGTFGKVKAAVHILTGEEVAVKVLEKARIKEVADAQRVAREIKILKRVRHPNVVQLFEVIDTPRQICLVMERVDGGELFDYIVRHRRLSEEVAAGFLLQLIEGLGFLHAQGVAHRDLKPENILLQSAPSHLHTGLSSATGDAMGSGAAAVPADRRYVLKIIDFGLSNTFEGRGMLKTACGSPCYAAPELLRHQPYRGELADVWSLGVVSAAE